MRSATLGLPGQRRPDERGGDLPSAVLTLAELDADAAADALHDGALQALVAARYASDAAVRGGSAAAARDAVQDALVALRRAVWMLRPRGEQGLREALQQLAVHISASGGAPVSLDVDEAAVVVLSTELSPAAATAAYRLVQRAAGEAPLTVRIRRTATGLRIALDVPLHDPAGEALRASVVGGALLATRDGASLHLPLAPALTPAALTPAALIPAHADDARPEVLR